MAFLTEACSRRTNREGLSPRRGDDASLIELRGLAKKTKKPQQTVIPPGVHETRERIRYVRFGPPTVVDGEGLRRAVQQTAVALATLQVWPGVGQRHKARLAFSKVLLKAGIDAADATRILGAVAQATGGDVADATKSVNDTAGRDPAETAGASWVIENLGRGKETLAVIDKILGRKPALPAGSFNVTDVDLKILTPQIWARVKDANDPALRLLHGGVPVRVVHVPENRNDRRPAYVLQLLEADRLRNEVAQVANFFKSRGNKNQQIAPPSEVIRDMLATPPAQVPLPVVTRIVYAPTMAPDGTILLAPGYQPATGTFYVDAGLEIPPVPGAPTDGDVKKAIGIIGTPLQDFAFVADADRTAAVAFFLLPFVRGLIDGPTPLHLFKKPVAGAGATLLTDTLPYLSVGMDIARMSTVSDDDEWRKQITSTLLDGPSAVLIDNARELLSPQLAKVLTDDIWQARILGVSRNAVLRVECVWGATGINPDLHQEVARRVVPCRLDPRMERPWLRTESEFRIPDLRSWSRDHRGEMIWAALTLARSWHAAGHRGGERSLGMFEGWSRVIGGVLKHAGFAGFLANLEELYEEADIEGDAVSWFYEEWNAHHQGRPVRLAEVACWALATGSPVLEITRSTSDAGRRMEFSKWARRLRNRVVEVSGRPLRIDPVKATGPSQRQTWRLAPADNQGLPPARPPTTEVPF